MHMLHLYSGHSRMYQYFFSFYTTLLLVLGNDLYPRSTTETFTACFMEFSGAIVQANLFGELAGIVYLLYES